MFIVLALSVKPPAVFITSIILFLVSNSYTPGAFTAPLMSTKTVSDVLSSSLLVSFSSSVTVSFSSFDVVIVLLLL